MRCFTFLLMTTIAAAVLPAEQHWNQFRGPHGDGTTTTTGLPVKFAENSPEIAWKTQIIGRGWSSPVVWDDQIWFTNGPEIRNPPGSTDENADPGRTPPLDKPIRLSAICLHLQTGKVVHDIPVFDVYQPQYTHPTNSYASPTPWIEAGRVYVHFGAYGTACLDTQTGEKLWERRDLKCHHSRGPGASPVVHGGLLFLCFDGYDKQFVVALDKHTGKTVWQREREIDYQTGDGDAKKAYCTPRVITVGRRSCW